MDVSGFLSPSRGTQVRRTTKQDLQTAGMELGLNEKTLCVSPNFKLSHSPLVSGSLQVQRPRIETEYMKVRNSKATQ